MKQNIIKHIFTVKSIFPLLLFLGYVFYRSLSFPLHDFANSYFPAHLAIYNNTPEFFLFDIYEFNNYIWSLGYNEVFADFYLNSPFNIVAFYPFAFIENAYTAKAVFNGISCILFVLSIAALIKRYGEKSHLLVYVIPVLFYVPIRNQILFGQTYFLIFALIVFSFLQIEKGKAKAGGTLLALASLLKVFPVFYGVVFVLNNNKKAIIYAVISGFLLLVLGITLTGTPVWKTYFLEVIPNVIANKSTVNFQFNSQSFDVFFKTLFIHDSYYNPNVLYNSERLYTAIIWIFKAVFLGLAFSMSFKVKKDVLALLSIWIVTLFLVQSRTATYAQILWIIPAFYIISNKMNMWKKTAFFLILFLLCNFPLSKLENLPILLRFSRMWFALILAIIVFSTFAKRKSFLFIFASIILLIPFNLSVFSNSKKLMSQYVLKTQEFFIIYDFSQTNNLLTYFALGKNGKETVTTKISVNTFNTSACKLVNNQIVLNGEQLTNDPSLKKKPVLINSKEVYYLTDSQSRRGAFTLKKININSN